MKSEKAHLIYWALADRQHFSLNFNQDSPEYWEIKKARAQMSKRYSELKSQVSFSEASYLASIEWLLSLED